MDDANVRILVFDLPPLLSDLVRRALEQHREITTYTAEHGALGEAVDETRPDAVIAPLDDGALADEGRRFVAQRAGVRVLGLGVQDGRAVLYQLLPQRTELGLVAPHEVAGLVLDAVKRGVNV